MAPRRIGARGWSIAPSPRPVRCSLRPAARGLRVSCPPARSRAASRTSPHRRARSTEDRLRANPSRLCAEPKPVACRAHDRARRLQLLGHGLRARLRTPRSNLSRSFPAWLSGTLARCALADQPDDPGDAQPHGRRSGFHRTHVRFGRRRLGALGRSRRGNGHGARRLLPRESQDRRATAIRRTLRA